MAFPSDSDSIDFLDLLLAERVLKGGLRGQKLMESRQLRDERWIIGALGCRGVNVTARDVEDCLAGGSGRFLPGQADYPLTRGLRAVIDHLEVRAEYGLLPDGRAALQMYELLTADLLELAPRGKRVAEPWEVLAGIQYPQPDELDGLIAKFHRDNGYLERLRDFDALHPLEQAATLLHRFVRVAPFRDFNLMIGALTASWYLIAHGYPPFLPQAVDRATMRAVLAGRLERARQWFGQVVLIGYRSLAA